MSDFVLVIFCLSILLLFINVSGNHTIMNYKRLLLVLPLILAPPVIGPSAVIVRHLGVEGVQVAYSCKKTKWSGVLTDELQKYPQNIVSSVPKIFLLPKNPSDTYLDRLAPGGEILRKFRDDGLLGRTLFDDTGNVLAVDLAYDSPRIRSTIHHEMAHVIWSKLKPENRSSLTDYLMTHPETLSSTSPFVFYEYIGPKYVSFAKSYSAFLHLFSAHLSETTRQFADTSRKLLDELSSHIAKTNTALKIGDTTSARVHFNKSNEFSSKIKLIRRALALTGQLSTSIQSTNYVDLPEDVSFSTFSAHVSSLISPLKDWIQKFHELESVYAELSINVRTSSVSSKQLESLKDELERIYSEELFARLMGEVTSNPSASDPVLRALLTSIQVDGVYPFAGLFDPSAAGGSSASKFPKTICYPY